MRCQYGGIEKHYQKQTSCEEKTGERHEKCMVLSDIFEQYGDSKKYRGRKNGDIPLGTGRGGTEVDAVEDKGAKTGNGNRRNPERVGFGHGND